MLSFTFWTTLILPALVVLASPVPPRDLSLTSLVNLVCPKGQTFFSLSNNGTVPASPGEVWSYIGNFCDPSWLDLEVKSTSGTCNAPTSSRSVLFNTTLHPLTLPSLNSTSTPTPPSFVLTQRLLLTIGSYLSPSPYQTYFLYHLELVGHHSWVPGASVKQVHELVQVEQDGVGAVVKWDVVGCANDTDAASAVFSDLHARGIQNTIAHFTP